MQVVGLLFWLKWKLLLRGYRKSKSEWAGALLLILIFTPIALGIAAWFTLNFVFSPPAEKANWLRTALLSIYAFWIIVPILGYSLNDSYDISRLFVYPLSMRQIFIGTIAGTLMDRPTILLLPTFVGVLIGFGRDPIAILITVIALGLFLLHTLALSQALLMAGAGVFQSRKFRDTAVILLPLIWVVYYMRFIVARQTRAEQWVVFVHSPGWELVNFLPQGWAARAIFSAYSGEYLPALVFLAGLALFTYATFVLAGWTLERVYAGETASAPSTLPAEMPPAPAASAVKAGAAASAVKAGAAASAAPTASPRSLLPPWLPPVVRAVADKEFRYLARDPYYKMILVNLLWPLLLPIFLSLRGGSGEPAGARIYQSSWYIWMGPAMMAFSQMQLSYNIFGTEGGAVSHLFLLPAARRQIVLGKNLFHFSVLSVFNVAMTAVVFALSRDVRLSALMFYWMQLCLLVNLALGNLFSLYFPMRVVLRGWRVQYRSSGQGCFYFVIYLAVWFASLLLFVPVAAALALPMLHVFGVSASWLVLSLPFGVVYVVAIYLFSLYLTDLLLPKREDYIIAKVSQEPQ
jgi:hypothetical protein